jgi:hypothetical protein
MRLNSQFYKLILGVLGVWRITHLLNAEDGPGRIFVRLRRLAGSGFWGELLDCFYCLSLWVSAPFAYTLGATWSERALLWLALSAAAILLERTTAKVPDLARPAIYEELPPVEGGNT